MKLIILLTTVKNVEFPVIYLVTQMQLKMSVSFLGITTLNLETIW
jgi:hypothetical protein